MAFGGLGAATTLEAEEVIRKWLKGVEYTGASQAAAAEYNSRQTSSLPVAREEGDYLGSLDWSHGSVADNARSIVESLLRKDLQNVCSPMSTAARSHDPQITMEMRHKKVKERRQLRDEKQRQHMESKLLLKQAQREAEEEVKREERKARDKAAQEEKLINLQVTLMRSQLRESQKTSRQVAMQQRSAIEKEIKHGSTRHGRQRKLERNQGLRDVIGTSPVIQKAEELLVSERKRQRTRSELLKQLEEAKAHETKENIKLLHHSFSAWYETVVLRRARLGKVVAVREWRAMVRVWAGWRRFVKERRERRVREVATKEMQRVQREQQVALEHYECHLLLKTLLAWRSAGRLAGAHRRQLEDQQVHRRKMDALLRAAAAMKAKEEPGSPGPPLQLLETPSKHMKHIRQVRHGSATAATPPPADQRKSTASRLAPLTPGAPEPAVWKVAKQQLAKLISEVDRIAVDKVGGVITHQDDASVGGDAPGSLAPPDPNTVLAKDAATVSTNGGSGQACHYRVLTQQRDKKAPPKPVTRPVPMAGMANRSAAISERRAAREKRRELMAQEKAERLAREEEERQRAEREAREAQAIQKREERRLAKQREMERLQRQQLQKELLDRAVRHYHRSLLRNMGLVPWRRFLKQCRISRAAADQLLMQLLQRMAFGVWSRQWRDVVERKEARARSLHSKILLRRMWRAWLKYVELGRELAELAVVTRPRLLVKRAFRAWCRVSKEGRMEYWEKMARARRFRQRFLQRQVLKVWSGYIPVAKEERAKELRRAELRRKVSSWLSDFQPPPPEVS